MPPHTSLVARSWSTALLAAAALFLAGCQSRYYQPTETTASQKSGVTVYGEVDTSVVHTR